MSSNDDSDRRAGRLDSRRFLTRRSALIKQIQAREKDVRILLAEDDDFDARRILSSLRILLGSHGVLLHARTADELLKAIRRGFAPDLVILDDRLGPASEATSTVPQIRAAGFAGPIAVVSGLFNPARQQLLSRIGGVALIDKDDIDAGRLISLAIGS